MKSTVVLLRAASLSVDEISGPAFGADRLADEFIEQAIGLAAGTALTTGLGRNASAAVERYAIRMASRATPFGLLAGTAFVHTAEDRSLALADRAAHRVFVRIDMAALEAVVTSATGCRSPRLLEPGCEPHELALRVLRSRGASEAAESLERLVSAVCGLRPAGQAAAGHLNAAWESCGIPDMIDIPEKARFHIDLDFTAIRGNVEGELVESLDRTLRSLQVLFPEQDPLADFRAAFRQRYEDGEVPLGEVLDFRSGLMETTLSAGSALASRAGVAGPSTSTDERRVPEAALRAYDHWRETGRAYDIAAHAAAERGVARSVQAALLDNHENAFDAVLLSGQARAPLASLARFALSRPEREQALHRWLAATDRADDDPIVAELVHTPGGRIGNVLHRPALHTRTLALKGAEGGTLDLGSLRLSLGENGFTLREGATGRRVVLELNSTHSVDFRGNDPGFRLLAHISGVHSVGWRWGGLSALSHLPRVTCGRVIVRPERWSVGTEGVQRLLAVGHPGAVLRDLLPGLGDRQWVGCGTGDRVLAVDLDSPRAVKAVVEKAAGRGRLEFIEVPHVESPAVSSPRGRHVAEVCIPLNGPRPAGARGSMVSGASVPGDEWVYWKYYCSSFTADSVIVRARNRVDGLRARGQASSWFFVRYGEGGHHVRIRVRPVRGEDRAAVFMELERLGRELQDEGLVSRACTDRYVPEIARYGGLQGIALAEELFGIDSDLVSDLLAASPSEERRLFHAVSALLDWIRGFYGDSPGEEQLVGILRRRVSPREKGGRLGSRYGAYFREVRKPLDVFLAERTTPTEVLAVLSGLRQGMPHGTPLPEAAAEGVFRSVVHMHMNRLFALDVQRLERLAYDVTVRKLLEHHARAVPRGDEKKDGRK
ncbi:lantibiotic dehydratase [Streptomyces goshikiensis]|uniref:lantibiotic dehydratase n=1 Tax=Streptomyces goshikiensis TaxID=1942 RepID=UPI0022F3C696|nr:lantibiotic dehydratase [Streptomyces goshikiensis]WBY20091.1 thiopeptide-type bacteriocin biosynthesis protein [Streptomyces goshikiensis]